MTDTDGTKYQFGSKQPIAETSLALQHAAMTATSRTRHRAAQQAGIFGCDPQVKFETASRVLTSGPVHDSLGSGIRFLAGCDSLHDAHLFFPYFRFVPYGIRED